VVPHPEAVSLNNDWFLKASTVSLENLSLANYQTESSPSYWGVSLDGRVIKTMYKDDLYVPSRALAIALAEEWAS